MADFEVKVRRLRLEPHPDADAIELACIDGYVAIVKKDQFQDGDLAAYIPEGSIVPENILQEMGLQGKLAGSRGNRVKAIRLRGVVSQGLVYPIPNPVEGEDVTERLGILKYVPTMPQTMSGEAEPAFGKTLKYDIENIKKYPNVLVEDEPVAVTEKIHGTFCQLGFHHDQPIITSKGLGAQGLVFINSDKNDTNVYVRAFRRHAEELEAVHQHHDTFYILGEIHGRGIQDLTYDSPEHRFRVFDIFVGEPGVGRFLDYDEMLAMAAPHFDVTPLAYRGNYSRAKIDELTNGESLVAKHLREGVVIKPIEERIDPELGRVILKSVSNDYLLRRGTTTEFE